MSISTQEPKRRSEVRFFLPDMKIRVLSYNIHHGRGLDGEVNLERTAETILNSKADLIGLQEVDLGVQRTQGKNLPKELARMTGCEYVFGPNLDYQGGHYGNALLSRYPIVSSRNKHYRMLRAGEQRGLLVSMVNLGFVTLCVANTHLDYRPDPDERLSNIEEMNDELRSFSEVVITGDFNAQPESQTYRKMVETYKDAWLAEPDQSGDTYSASKPSKRIDYVFFRGRRITSAGGQVGRSSASDHLPLWIDLQVEE